MKRKSIISALIPMLFLVILAPIAFSINAPKDAARQYFCDRSILDLALQVDVRDNNNNSLYQINGEFFSSFEDDLAMVDNDDKVVRKTDDQYNWITQNDHVICDDENILYYCDGNLKVFADSYTVLNADGKQVANVEFNWFDTKGIMKDSDGNVIARYDSAMWRHDYFVSIYENCPIDDQSLLMIFASYVSDVRSDSNS